MSINKKKSPNLYVIAGPNGAGKTTFAREFLPHYAKCSEFVNAEQNLFARYRPVLDSWMLFDNSGTVPQLIAREELGEIRVFNQALFARIRKG